MLGMHLSSGLYLVNPDRVTSFILCTCPELSLSTCCVHVDERRLLTIRADILASDLSKNDPTLFWKHGKYVSKQNNGSLKLADTVGEATGHIAIASMWNDHYSQLLNCVKSDTHKSAVLDAIVSGECDMFNHNDVKSAVASLSVNKACGMDSLSAEHLLYISPEIHTLLAIICFNAFIVHGFHLVL